MVDHDILRFNISMHDSHRMSVMQPFQHLIYVQFAFFRRDYLQQLTIVSLIDIFENQTVHFPFPHDIKKFDGIISTCKSHQNLDFPVNFFEFN